MAINLYDTRAMLAAIEAMPPEYSFLYDFFCRDAGVVQDDKAIYDYRKGSTPMAPMVRPGAGGVVMDRDGFETREIGFTQIAPERIIEDTNLKGRIFGEQVMGALTPTEREKRLLARDLKEMRAAIQRRIEWMVRQVIFTGKLEIFTYTNEGRGKEATMVADYHFDNNFTPDTAWNQSGAKIVDDMERIHDIVQAGGGFVDRIWMAPDVASAIRENSNYIRLMDGRNIDMGKLNSRYVNMGVRFVGFNPDGIPMYSASGTFLDDNGKVTPIIPKGHLVAGSQNMLNAYYGPITQVEETGMNAQHKTYFKKQVALRHGSIDGNSIKNRLTSCPTIVPTNVDAWAVAKVL